MTLTPRSRRFVLWMAQVALLVYVAQIAAVDHWHGATGHLRGLPDASAHAVHCHGAPSGCADGAFLAPVVAAKALLPVPPEPRLQRAAASFVTAAGVIVATPHQPPRTG